MYSRPMASWSLLNSRIEHPCDRPFYISLFENSIHLLAKWGTHLNSLKAFCSFYKIKNSVSLIFLCIASLSLGDKDGIFITIFLSKREKTYSTVALAPAYKYSRMNLFRDSSILMVLWKETWSQIMIFLGKISHDLAYTFSTKQCFVQLSGVLQDFVGDKDPTLTDFARLRNQAVIYRWINCIAEIAPKKKIVGTAIAWIASQRTVKIGYVIASADFLVVIWIGFQQCVFLR